MLNHRTQSSGKQEPTASTKTCGKCGEAKPLSDFYRNRKGKYGRRSDCKSCNNIARNENAKHNPDRREYMRKHMANYRRNHPDRVRATVERGRDAKRAKREAQKRPQVYRINFANGCYYFGKSNCPKRRFLQHIHAARHGVHVAALNVQDWNTASWEVLMEFDTDDEALAAEYKLIEEHMNDPNNLNTQTKEKRSRLYYVYVIQSAAPRVDKKGKPRPGFFYVGMTTDPARRLREHNGLYADGSRGNPKGGKYTSKHRPWEARALYGPFVSRSEALRAEYQLKSQKRGAGRMKWSTKDSPLCRGEGPDHPWVKDPKGWKPPNQ